MRNFHASPSQPKALFKQGIITLMIMLVKLLSTSELITGGKPDCATVQVKENSPLIAEALPKAYTLLPILWVISLSLTKMTYGALRMPVTT